MKVKDIEKILIQQYGEGDGVRAKRKLSPNVWVQFQILE